VAAVQTNDQPALLLHLLRHFGGVLDVRCRASIEGWKMWSLGICWCAKSDKRIFPSLLPEALTFSQYYMAILLVNRSERETLNLGDNYLLV